MSITRHVSQPPPFDLEKEYEELSFEDQIPIYSAKDAQLQTFRVLKILFDKFKDNFPALLSNAAVSDLVPPSKHSLLSSWIKEILICRSLFQSTLSSANFGSGLSKGFLFVIRQVDDTVRRTVGYLFGTAHKLKGEEQKILHLNQKVLKNLKKCPVLLTEIKSEVNDTSVEGSLVSFAREWGIVNLGIDDETYRENLPPLDPSSQELPANDYSELMWSDYLDSYYKGDRLAIEENPFTLEGEEAERANTRNAAMSTNIAAFINAASGLKQKIFAAVGNGHLFNKAPEAKTVQDFLQKNHGFSVEYVEQ